MFGVEGKVHVESHLQHWVQISSPHIPQKFWKKPGLNPSGPGH